jgi:hypothetical protein
MVGDMAGMRRSVLAKRMCANDVSVFYLLESFRDACLAFHVPMREAVAVLTARTAENAGRMVIVLIVTLLR